MLHSGASWETGPVKRIGLVYYLLAALLLFGASSSSLTAPAAAQSAPSNILVVGDSLEVGTAPNLGGMLPGASITSDAAESRSSSAVLDALAENFDPGFDVVVFDAGTNDDPANPGLLASNLEQAASLIGDRCMVIATVNRPPYNGVTVDGINDVVRAFAASRPNTQVADWRSAALANPGLLYSDAIHPTPDGYQLRAQLIAGAIASCGTSLPPGAGEPETESPPPPPEPPPLTPAERRARAQAQTTALLAELAMRRVASILDSPEAFVMLGLTLLTTRQGEEPKRVTLR